MDPQQLLSEPGLRDENAHEWTHRPPNLSLSAVAQTNAPQPLLRPDGPETLDNFPMGIDLQQTSQPTSLVAFQPYQKSAGFSGHSQVQKPDWPEEVQRELAEADFRHTAACWEILDRANAFSATLYPQQVAALYIDAVTDKMMTGYSGVSVTPNMPMVSQQILGYNPIQNDSSSMHGFDLDLWPTQQIAQTALSPHSLENRVQHPCQFGTIFPDAQDYDPGAFYQATYRQQTTMDPMLLRTSPYNMMIPVPDTYGQENYPSCFKAPSHGHSAQSLLTSQGVESVPVNASELPAYPIINSVYNVTAPFAGSSWNGDTTPYGNHPLSTTTPEFPSFPVIDQSATTYLDLPGTEICPDPSQTMAVAATINGNQRLPAKRKLCVSDSAGDSSAGPSHALDNIYFHTNPEADRQRKGTLPKRRKVTSKASWSCFGCRLNKRKCEPSTDGFCLRCQEILNKNSYRTPVQRFTCNVRTKFSEISIFTNISPTRLSDMELLNNLTSSLPRPLRIEWDDGSTPVTIGGHTKLSPRAVMDVVYKLLGRVRNFLDIMEPLHNRQASPSKSVVFWSYSFSTIRWKRAICFLWPCLKDALDFHEEVHRVLHLSSLAQIDPMLFRGDYSSAALLLNVWYEGICTMETSPMVDSCAKEHLQSSLTHHILHVYRSLFPSNSSVKKSRPTELDGWAIYFNMFSQTSGLLPPEYRRYPMGSLRRITLREYHRASDLERQLSLEKEFANCRKPSQPLECPFPMLKAYVPPQLLAVFGLDTETLDSSTELQWMEPVEGLIREYLMGCYAQIQEEILDLSPFTLSIGAKAAFDQSATSNYARGQENEILRLVIKFSLIANTLFMAAKEAAVQRDASESSISLSDFALDNGNIEDVILQGLCLMSESFMDDFLSSIVKYCPET